MAQLVIEHKAFQLFPLVDWLVSSSPSSIEELQVTAAVTESPFPSPPPKHTPFIVPTPRSTHKSYYFQNQIFRSSMFVMLRYNKGYYLLLVHHGWAVKGTAVAAGHVRDEHAQYNNIPRGHRLSFCKLDTRTEGVGRTSAISRDNHVSWGAFCLQKARILSLFVIKTVVWKYDRLHLLFVAILARKPVKHVWHGRVSEILWQAIS